MHAFHPPPHLAHPVVQTMAGSLRWRARGLTALERSTFFKIIETGAGVKLQAAVSRPASGRGPLVILLHGWEGSANSAYIVTTARFLFENSWHVVRLNLRDHGATHHLNTGLFYASRLDEVCDSIVHICRKWRGLPIILCGFSLGGNFALRTALRLSIGRSRIPNLAHVVAVSPVIDPAKTTKAVDNTRLIRSYFLFKWRKSLIKKQQAHPGRYDFGRIIKMDRIETITAALLERYSPFENTEAYFDTYTLTGDRLGPIRIPTTILTAADDPIIPVEDIYGLRTGPAVRKIVLRRGGHNGFVRGLSKGAWYFDCLKKLGERAMRI